MSAKPVTQADLDKVLALNAIATRTLTAERLYRRSYANRCYKERQELRERITVLVGEVGKLRHELSQAKTENTTLVTFVDTNSRELDRLRGEWLAKLREEA